jgi:predicted CxxxxCH...CXXCH cytochrome family protein
VIAKDTASSAHQAVTDTVREQLRSWVVDCKVSYFRSVYHQGGVLNPEDPQQQFHGSLLREAGYQLSACSGCHGTDLAGGPAKVSCMTCHPQGVTTCGTCHSRLPAAHQAHTKGTTQGKSFACTECHPQRFSWMDPGHVFEADGSVRTTPARVEFGALANLSPIPSLRMSPASFDPASKQCSAVYCHGGAFSDASARNVSPLWSAGAPDAACGTCHGIPPAGHDPKLVRCVLCHNRSVTDAQKLVVGGLHVNGKRDVGDGNGTCSACHGYTGSTQFQDLLRQTDPTGIGVGAHAAHVNASHRLSAPIACTECHGNVAITPDTSRHTVTGLGVNIFAAGGSAKLSGLEGAQPKWDRMTARCSTNYCHGGGSKLLPDLSTGVNRSPVWTASNQASCGSCHGIPPKDGNHLATMRLGDCVTCHAKTIDGSGTILFTGPAGSQKTTHLNGVADGN